MCVDGAGARGVTPRARAPRVAGNVGLSIHIHPVTPVKGLLTFTGIAVNKYFGVSNFHVYSDRGKLCIGVPTARSGKNG